MNQFAYVPTNDVAGAVSAGSQQSTRYIAGGTTLIDLMKCSVETPTQVVDITALPALNQIEEMPTTSQGGKGLRIGALVTNSALAHDERVQKRFPVLSQAILAGASPQLRNMATTGGNLLQRTRCQYFRDPLQYAECNKRNPGSGCAAMEGYNRSHAVLGTSKACIATNPSDMCVAMMVLDAVINLTGPDGNRSVPILEFYTLPGEHPEIEQVLNPGELITSVDVHDSPAAQNSLYLKVRDRASYEFALASAAVCAEIGSDGTITQARIGLGGVATKPWRSAEAEKTLQGQKPTADLFKRSAEAALTGAVPQKHKAFKIEMSKRTLVRALTQLTAQIPSTKSAGLSTGHTQAEA
jgi:xanthine dehydrogenase YagS FAD-binding subunit